MIPTLHVFLHARLFVTFDSGVSAVFPSIEMAESLRVYFVPCFILFILTVGVAFVLEYASSEYSFVTLRPIKSCFRYRFLETLLK